MAIKLVFDNVEDFKELFNFFNILEEDGTGMIDETIVPLDPVDDAVLSLDDFADEKGVVDYDDLPPQLQEEVMLQPSIDFEKVIHYGKYRYDLYGMYFKTRKGKSGRILITGAEALQIIPMIQEGLSDKQIYNKMLNEYGGFMHDKGTMHNTATLSTITTFRKRYDAMELNNAIGFYCNNSRVNQNPLDYVKFPDLDDASVECEDLWH